jgi:hypothetical protein
VWVRPDESRVPRCWALEQVRIRAGHPVGAAGQPACAWP